MSLSPATTDSIFAPDEAYLASGTASPRPRCKLDLAKGSVDVIELSLVTPVEMPNYDSESPSILSRAQPQVKPRTQRTREQIQLTALCWFVYLEGWNDGSNGPLLPRIQQVYGVHFLVSCVVTSC